jgi:phosphoribosylglycinamide formyltransferase-1|tara:strand:- start:59 stop:574 length:516 start_codon:yes stop_codon:yes gene_type:complete
MRLGVMCSGNGSNFENIHHACPKHDIVIMVYNKKKAKAKRRADRLDIPSCYSKDEDEIIALFNAYEVDMIVMAGWMRIISKKFCDEFAGRIINLHPSLLPKYKGLHAVEQALKAGEDETGCTVHFVNEYLDSGAIIKQQVVPILPDDNVESLTRAIQQAEHSLLPSVINAF